MAKRYAHENSRKLTPDNWQELVNLKEMSLADMVNMFGDMKEMKGLSDKVAGYLREAIIIRMPEDEDEFRTDNFEVKRSIREGTRFDTKAVKAEFGDDWYAERCNTTETTFVTITRLEEE